MPISRRTLVKLGAVGGAIGLSSRVRATIAAERSPRPLRILILGGTGFIGPSQVAYALARGHTVSVFNRGRHETELPDAVELLVGDRDSGDLAALAGREWDVCIDNPVRVPHWVRDVGRVLQGKVGQYILVSTISVYAKNDTPGADENAALLAYAGKDALQESSETLRKDQGLYGPLKVVCEHEAAKQFPHITTIVRPSLIAGPGDPTDRFTYWPLRMARGGDIAAPGDGSDPVQFIDVRDLSEWMLRLAESRTFGTFNAIGPGDPLHMDGMLHGIDPDHARLHWLPIDFLKAQHIESWSDMPVWVPAHGDSAGFAQRSNAKARAAGLVFRPLAVTAADTLAWFRSLPAERQAKPGAGLGVEREAALLAAWQAAGKRSV
ncbi:MAG: NAD-dependent epimerase/dehydratase family protein [Dokdonella sp.]